MKKVEYEIPHVFIPTGAYDGGFVYFSCVHCGKTYCNRNKAPQEKCPTWDKFVLKEK